MATLRAIAVVGASLAGLRAVETLRRKGFDGTITLIGAEPHLPYDRPPLSKEILTGRWEVDRLPLRRQDYAELELDLRLGRRAVALDVAEAAAAARRRGFRPLRRPDHCHRLGSARASAHTAARGDPPAAYAR